MASTSRAQLVNSAVSFLQDAQTQRAPLEKRLEFLRAKGLTSEEIDEAFRQAGLGPSTPVAAPGNEFAVPTSSFQQPSYTMPYGYQPQPQPPPVPERDWRDYFIMAVVSGGVMFGLASLARKYLFPHLVPPPLDAFQQSQKDLERQFDELAAQLGEVQTTTQAELKLVEEQSVQVTKAVDDVNTAINEMRQNEDHMRSELQEIREEVGNVRDMIPKLVQSSQANATATLEDLQSELKSLKALLLARPPTHPGAHPVAHSFSGTSNLPYGGGTASAFQSPMLGPGRSPAIPAWQLASHGSLHKPSSLLLDGTKPSVNTDAHTHPEEKESSLGESGYLVPSKTPSTEETENA